VSRSELSHCGSTASGPEDTEGLPRLPRYGLYMRGLVAPFERKNGWTPAEEARACRPRPDPPVQPSADQTSEGSSTRSTRRNPPRVPTCPVTSPDDLSAPAVLAYPVFHPDPAGLGFCGHVHSRVGAPTAVRGGVGPPQRADGLRPGPRLRKPVVDVPLVRRDAGQPELAVRVRSRLAQRDDDVVGAVSRSRIGGSGVRPYEGYPSPGQGPVHRGRPSGRASSAGRSPPPCGARSRSPAGRRSGR
jgi:hypothetical protein